MWLWEWTQNMIHETLPNQISICRLYPLSWQYALATHNDMSAEPGCRTLGSKRPKLVATSRNRAPNLTVTTTSHSSVPAHTNNVLQLLLLKKSGALLISITVIVLKTHSEISDTRNYFFLPKLLLLFFHKPHFINCPTYLWCKMVLQQVSK